jgi:hypothetical protein
MNWSFFKPRKPAQPLEITRQQEIRLASKDDGAPAAAQSPKPARTRASWFGWLWGRNRRRDSAGRWVQGELLLQQVRPVRNDFRDSMAPAESRRRPKVIYETPLMPERRDDQDHAWNRLRNRHPASLQVSSE